jgi:hypothetical protein
MSWVWKHFKVISEVEGVKKKCIAKCMYCPTQFSFPNATRMKRHLALKCISSPAEIKKKASLELKDLPSCSSVEIEDEDEIFNMARTSQSNQQHSKVQVICLTSTST